jgi:hypothetical protein
MRASEMSCANPELLERPGQVTEPAGDADECGREKPNRRLGLLIIVSTAAVLDGAVVACIRHFL